MNDLLIIAFRTVFLYILILVILRIMGKREVGELSLFDVVVFVIMAEVAAFALDSPDNKLSHAVFPMIILLIIQLTSSYISLKSKKFRDLVDGEPSVIIRNGHIEEAEMRRQRYNLDDLFQQLREQQVGSVLEVTFAFLEPSGNLSVFTKDQTQPVLPLISDGIMQTKHLELTGIKEEDIRKQLNTQGVKIEQVFYCTFEDGKFRFQLKAVYQ